VSKFFFFFKLPKLKFLKKKINSHFKNQIFWTIIFGN
jgi:hypothetical protein